MCVQSFKVIKYFLNSGKPKYRGQMDKAWCILYLVPIKFSTSQNIYAGNLMGVSTFADQVKAQSQYYPNGPHFDYTVTWTWLALYVVWIDLK